MRFIFIEAVELVAIAAIAYFASTQVIVPLWRGTQLFPFLLKRAHRLNVALAKTMQDVMDAQVEEEIEEKKQEAARIRGSKKKEEEKNGPEKDRSDGSSGSGTTRRTGIQRKNLGKRRR